MYRAVSRTSIILLIVLCICAEICLAVQIRKYEHPSEVPSYLFKPVAAPTEKSLVALPNYSLQSQRGNDLQSVEPRLQPNTNGNYNENPNYIEGGRTIRRELPPNRSNPANFIPDESTFPQQGSNPTYTVQQQQSQQQPSEDFAHIIQMFAVPAHTDLTKFPPGLLMPSQNPPIPSPQSFQPLGTQVMPIPPWVPQEDQKFLTGLNPNGNGFNPNGKVFSTGQTTWSRYHTTSYRYSSDKSEPEVHRYEYETRNGVPVKSNYYSNT